MDNTIDPVAICTLLIDFMVSPALGTSAIQELLPKMIVVGPQQPFTVSLFPPSDVPLPSFCLLPHPFLRFPGPLAAGLVAVKAGGGEIAGGGGFCECAHCIATER